MQRKYFGTDGIRGRVGSPPITAECALRLGWAVGKVLAHTAPSLVLIGEDTRLSGNLLRAALEAGLMAAGAQVGLLGILPTPGVAYLTRSLGASAGIVVSASHNPYYDNGIKIFNHQGSKLADVIEQQLEALIDIPSITNEESVGRTSHLEAMGERYLRFCQSTVLPSCSLKGLKVVLDCANGATHLIAPQVFAELGMQVITLHAQPDGMNINEACGSTHPQALQAAVLRHQADCGIAFDGDGDRVIMVDQKGEVVDGDELLFIIAKSYKRQGKLQGGVVGTFMSNLGLERAFSALAIPFLRTPVGDRYVMERLQQQGWQLGGEASGHIICLDKMTTGDGIVAALQVLSEMASLDLPLHELKKGMQKCAQILINVPVCDGQEVISNAHVQAAYCASVNKLSTRGRILLRPSGTEPLVRVMVEGEDIVLMKEVIQELTQVIKNNAIEA